MQKRTMQGYIGLSRSGRGNVRYSRPEEQAKTNKPSYTIANQLSDFFMNNIIGWFIHDWRIKKPFSYPTALPASIHLIPETGRPVVLALSADWASDTQQAQYIGECINGKEPDYTIHLGDTYYAGTGPELEANFGDGKSNPGIWPRGRSGCFALCGNHEMYSSGSDYLKMIQTSARGFGLRLHPDSGFSGQEAPCFCLKTAHWLVMGLDTGYQSLKTGFLRFHPNNLKLEFPAVIMQWLKEKVFEPGEKRGIILLTHHQYVSAFHGEDEFIQPAVQLKSLLPEGKELLWIWGHEHRFAIYGRNQLEKDHIAAFGRCIGNGGMPDEHTRGRYLNDGKATKRNLLLYDKRTADRISFPGLIWDSSREVGFNGYAMLSLTGAEAEITYYASYKRDDAGDSGCDEAVFKETWQCDTGSGVMNNTGAVDLTKDKAEKDRLTPFPITAAAPVA